MEDVLIRLRMVPKYPGTMLCKDAADEIERLRAELAGCRALLRRCLPIIESDAQMMADLSRFAPLDPVAQATHDATEYDSERLVREIPAALAKDDAARKGEETQ